MSVKTEKAALRSAMRGRRSVFVRGRETGLGRQLSEVLLSHAAALGLTAGCRAAAYWPMAGEADPRWAMERLHRAGVRFGLPVVLGPGKPLVFRQWHPEQELEKGAHGTWQPPEGEAELIPSVVLVPLVAFDRKGWRLGQGGGYYDRTLVQLRRGGGVRAVGIGYSCQATEAVPHEATDQRLDWLVTEEDACEAERV